MTVLVHYEALALLVGGRNAKGLLRDVRLIVEIAWFTLGRLTYPEGLYVVTVRS